MFKDTDKNGIDEKELNEIMTYHLGLVGKHAEYVSKDSIQCINQ